MRTRALMALTALGATSFAAPAQAVVAGIDERGFIDDFVAIPSEVLAIVGEVLPESSQVGSSYLSGSFDPNLVIIEPANVMLSFVHEGAGYLNSLGYFTYTSDGSTIQIVDRQLVFPNASYADPNEGWGGGKLSTGDTVTLRDAFGAIRVFQPGERVGFFIVSNGWQKSTASVYGWDPADPKLPFATSKDNAAWRVMTTLDVLNPEISAGFADRGRHVAMLRVAGRPGFLGGEDFVLVGFEDQRRDTGSDNDFNDLVMIVRSNPIEAIDRTEIPYYASDDPDPDGDGVEGLADYFPQDPDRAFIVRTPPTGWQTLAFEDRYPDVGDADYNDAVVQLAFEEVLDAKGRLKDVSGTFHLFARGATLDHQLGVAIEGLPLSTSGTIDFERFAPFAESSELDPTQELSELLGDTDGGLRVRIDGLFASTQRALSPSSGPYSNTTSPELDGAAASVRFIASFDDAVVRAPLGAPPYDPYLLAIHGSEMWDIHLPGKSGFEDRPGNLPFEEGKDSFVDGAGRPFALLLPSSWRFPLERVDIRKAYPLFEGWATSRGTSATGWHLSPSTTASAPRVTNAMPETLRSRPWSLRVTAR